MPPVPKPIRAGKKVSRRIVSTQKTLDKRQREKEILSGAIRLSDARDDKRGLNGKCIACFMRIPLPNGAPGRGMASDWNHCIPRSRLSDFAVLHSPENLSHVCLLHHDAYDRHPEFWLPIMKALFGYAYDQAPFAWYVQHPHPLVAHLVNK